MLRAISSEATETLERIKSEGETLKQQHLEGVKVARYLGGACCVRAKLE